MSRQIGFRVGETLDIVRAGTLRIIVGWRRGLLKVTQHAVRLYSTSERRGGWRGVATGARL